MDTQGLPADDPPPAGSEGGTASTEGGAGSGSSSLSEVDRALVEGDRDLVRLMITLTTATVVFAGTFVGDIVGDEGPGETSRWILYLSWIVLILSTLIGLVAHGRLSQILVERNYNPEDSGLVWTLRLQQSGLLVGLILFITFAALELPS